MMASQRFRDTRTNEIVTQVPISEITHFEEYSGPSETRCKCDECGAKDLERQFYVWRREDLDDPEAFDISGAEPTDMGSDFWCQHCDKHTFGEEYENAEEGKL